VKDSTLQALTATYHLSEQPSWGALQRHLALTRRADVLFLITPDASGATVCRHALEQALSPSKRSLHQLQPDVPNDPATLADCLLNLPPAPDFGVLWVQLPADVPHDSLPDAQAAWDRAFTALNPHRNPILQSLPAPLIFAGPAWMFQSFRSHAPDWFSIRSGVFDLAGDIARSASTRKALEPAQVTPTRPPVEPELPKPEFRFDFSALEPAEIQQALAALTPSALQLLQTLSWLDPAEPIPLWFLATHPPLPQDTEPAQALDELVKARLLQRSTDQQWLLLSASVAAAVSAAFQDDGKRGASLNQAELMLLLADLGVAQNANNWSRWLPAIPHILCLAEYAEKQQNWPLAISWRCDVASVYQVRAQYSDAMGLYRAMLTLAETHLPPADPLIDVVRNNLASILKSLGRYQEAEVLFRQAIESGGKHLGLENGTVATRFNNLAELLRITGRQVEAEVLLWSALNITEKALGPEHPAVGIRLNNLASLLLFTGRPADAEPLYRRALAIEEKALGPDHTEVATTLGNFAELLRATGRHAEAEEVCRRAVVITEKVFGANHPSVALRMVTLAAVLADLGKMQEALQLIQRAVSILQRHGEDNQYVHPELAKAQRWLEDIQQAVG
jgi:tetratricopeptide (TPR) repeat protein